MTGCNFQAANTPWTCTLCGWVYPRPSAKPPRRNCPKSPQGIAGRIINLEAEARAERSKMLYAREPAELTRVITTCLACQKYDNRCNATDCKNGKCDVPRYLSGCVGRRHWLKALSSVGFRECPKWLQ